MSPYTLLRSTLRTLSTMLMVSVAVTISLPALSADSAMAGKNGGPSQFAGGKNLPTPQALMDKLASNGPVFIENRGQFDSRVKFQVRTERGTLWLTNDGIVFDFARPKQGTPPHQKDAARPTSRNAQTEMERLVSRQKFMSSNATPNVEALDPVPGIYNYFIGTDPNKWRTHIQAYKRVLYRDVWKGIDLRLFANGTDLEEEFIVHPGADLTAVQVAYEGTQGLIVSDDGSLKITTAFGELTETAPHIYQESAGKEAPISGKFKVAGNTYAFEVARRDQGSDLIIDPTVIFSKKQPRGKANSASPPLYSTYLGGSATCNGFCGPTEYAAGIAVDASGSAYVGGTTGSNDFPTTPGVYEEHSPSGECGFVTKFTPLGNQLQYSTYLCGVDMTVIAGVGIDSSGDAYVIGSSGSSYPTTPNALQPTVNGVFLTVLSPAGDALLYSTGFGSHTGFACCSDSGPIPMHPIAVDSLGRAYLTGAVNCGYDIPLTANAYQSSCAAGSQVTFLGVLDPSQSGQASLIYGSYLGGSYQDEGSAVAVDAYGMAYITGGTYSRDFPVTPGAYQTGPQGPPGTGDGFVAKFNPAASSNTLLYSTYLGGSGNDFPHAITADSSGNAYITGVTDSDNFPVMGAIIRQRDMNASFVTKLNAAGNNLVFSTFWGGQYCSPGNTDAIVVDVLGNTYVAGSSHGQLLVSSDAYQPQLAGDCDAFVSKFDPTGSTLIYSSYLGGAFRDAGMALAIDSVGDAYLAGWTTSPDFPVTQAAYQQQLNGRDDAFVTKLPLGGSGTLSITGILPNAGGNAGSVTAQIIGSGFHQGATAKLVCDQSNVPGNNMTLSGGGQILTATYDLTHSAPGLCDVVVTNVDKNSVMLSKEFTVQQGGAFDLLVQKMGTAALPGANMKYYVGLANIGNVDAAPDLAVTETVQPWFAFQGSTPRIDTTYQADKLWPPSDVGKGGKFDEVLEWSISSLAPQSVKNIVYGVQLERSTPVGLTVSGPACVSNIRQAEVAVCATGLVACMVGAGVECAPLLPAPPLYAACLIGSAVLCNSGLNDCLGVIDKWCDIFDREVQELPKDPNYLIGSSGTGDQGWVRPIYPLNYAVHFENDPQVKTPAQVVIVTTPLDVELDLSSLQLSDISMAGYSIPISPNIFSTSRAVRIWDSPRSATGTESVC